MWKGFEIRFSVAYIRKQRQWGLTTPWKENVDNDGGGMRIASGFGAMSSIGRALGAAWRDII